MNPDFKSKIKTVFNGDVESVDFSNHITVPTINKWVSYKTNGLIETLLDGSWKNYVNLPMASTNIIYFKGTWMKEFKPENAKTEKFKSPKGQRNVKMMNIVEDTRYSSNEKFQYVKKSFDGACYMEFILPAEGISIKEAVKLFTPEMYHDLTGNTSEYRVTLGLPSFTTKFKTDIASSMKKIGVDMSAMNLSGIGIGTQSVGSNQEISLKVYEEGVEFAAVTGGWASAGPVSPTYPEVEIKFDRPFIYLIRSSYTNTILLYGTVVNP